MRELSLHILDIIRNSIESGATELHLEIEEDPAADRLTISLRDNGRGMSPQELEKACDPFHTSRTTRRVGLGLPLFSATCRRCEGDLVIESIPGTGTTVCCTMQLNHIDRPPLGDMGAVLQSLGCEADHVALFYIHKVGDEMFQLDTCYLQTDLGPGALSTPVTLLWLRRHVNEALKELGSTA